MKKVKDWSSQHIVVIGASGGLGTELCAAFWKRGATVTSVTRSDNDIARKTMDKGGVVLKADITESKSRHAIADYLKHSVMPVTGVIFAQGLPSDGALEKHTGESIAQIIKVNLEGPMQLVQELKQKHLLKGKWLHFVGSMYGHIGFPGQSVYSATKAGLFQFSEAIRREWSDTHIEVFYAAPRAIKTNFNREDAAWLNHELGSKEDTPRQVAERICQQLEKGKARIKFGSEERFFALLNSFVPRLLDKGLRKAAVLLRQHTVKA